MKVRVVVCITCFILWFTLGIYASSCYSSQPQEGISEAVAEEEVSKSKPKAQNLVSKSETSKSTKSVKKTAKKTNKVAKKTKKATYSGKAFKRDGVWRDKRFTYTWYSSKVLRHYMTSKWHVNSEGVYEDSKGYVVVASSDYKKGTTIKGTMFGTVKVYDCGCPHGVLDVYVNF